LRAVGRCDAFVYFSLPKLGANTCRIDAAVRKLYQLTGHVAAVRVAGPAVGSRHEHHFVAAIAGRAAYIKAFNEVSRNSG
jgi:hypothetical protein